MYALGLITTLILLIEVKNLEQNKKIYNQSLLMGLCLGLMLISKQTHGFVLSIATLVLQAIAVFRYKNIKQIFIYTCLSFLPIASIILILTSYLYKTNTINDFYLNVFGGISSKGNLNDLIFHHFKVLADSNLIWVLYISIVTFIVLFTAIKNFNPNFVLHKNKYDNLSVLILCIACGVLVSVLSLFCVNYFKLNIFDIKLFFQIDMFFKQFCAIGFVFTDIYVFYLFFDYIFNGKYNRANFYFLVFLGMIFAMNYSSMLSKSMTNLTFISIGILFAWILQQETPLYKLKNGLIYLFTLIFLFLGVTSKIICPSLWHNWESGSLIEKRKEVSNVPFLKGMKLPEKEAEFFREIREISDKYTNENDRIYCFLNNQLFYKILERKPLTKNANLYFDLCSDEKALQDMEKLVNNPPKLIIWLKFPEDVINLHENLFRNGMLSGQRHINYAISNMIENNKYKIIKVYKNKYSDFYNNYTNFITDKNYRNNLEQITKKIREKEALSKKETNRNYNEIYTYNKEIENLQSEKNKILNQVKKELNIEHYRCFLPNNYELYILVENNTYKNKELFR